MALRHVIITFLLGIVCAGLASGQTVNVWLTTDNQSQKMQPQASVTFTTGGGGTNPVIVDETQTYQQIEGFGASFTDSAAYLLNQVATPSARTAAMNDLFTRTGGGIGVSLVRNPMGASDLARFHYSYDDLPPGQTDPALTFFSIAHDQADIIPLIQQARQLNPQLRIMATPWSPPGWMKSSGSLIGGALLPSMYTPFANYSPLADSQEPLSPGPARNPAVTWSMHDRKSRRPASIPLPGFRLRAQLTLWAVTTLDMLTTGITLFTKTSILLSALIRSVPASPAPEAVARLSSGSMAQPER